ncbi:MAG: ribosomal protein [Patescibacteria group bacterium]|nr:ribosomal protein [Patescibacteria group bacterium]
MSIKKYNPTTPSRREMTGYSFDEITATEPYKPLTFYKKNAAGRNNTGRITVRHQGGGHKRLYRMVDFSFDKKEIPAKVETIEYDPNRTGYIALVCYRDGERRYVLAHKDMKVGDTIITSESAKPVPGNRLLIGNIPVGLSIHNVELIVGLGASTVRSAGSAAVVMSQEGEYTQVKLPSGEIRRIHKKCWATVGTVSNTFHNQIVIGKAGRSRWMNRRPTVLGSSMNTVDHPHGGGEGHQSLGQRKGPKTPWGKITRGVITRNRKSTDKWIVRTKRGKLMG